MAEFKSKLILAADYRPHMYALRNDKVKVRGKVIGYAVEEADEDGKHFMHPAYKVKFKLNHREVEDHIPALHETLMDIGTKVAFTLVFDKRKGTVQCLLT